MRSFTIFPYIILLYVALANSSSAETYHASLKDSPDGHSHIITANQLELISDDKGNASISSAVETIQFLSQNALLNMTGCKHKDISLTSASSEHWTAGMAGGGSGTEYYFKVKINTRQKIDFDSVWINNQVFEAYVARSSKVISNEPVTYGKGDEITVRVSAQQGANSNAIGKKPPFEYEGAALISYRVNNKRKYFIVRQIAQIKSPDRQ